MKSTAGILAAGVAVALSAAPSFAAWPQLGGIGVTVCDSTSDPHAPASAPDGSGGAYFAWLDSRDPSNRRFFAQHVSGSGSPMWPANGISVGSTLVRTNTGGDPPVIVGDGQGGALVLWREFRNDTAGNLYAQRLASDGSLLWGPDGVPVSLGARHETSIAAARAGAGGMFVAWRDDRDSIFTIRAQRIDNAGNLAWDADGVVVCPSHGRQQAPRVADDGQDGALVAWTELRGGAEHGIAQRLTAAGDSQWAPLGVQLSSSLSGIYVEDIAPDGTGGVVASYLDYRSQNTWGQTFAQRVSADGDLAWGLDGVSLSGPAYFVAETFVQGDGQGGAWVGWQDHRSGGMYGVLAQRLSSTGEALWTLPGVVVATPPVGGGWEKVRMLPDAGDGMVFAWNADAGGGNYSIYARRLSPTGETEWATSGVVLASLAGITWQLTVVPDGTGGVVAAWIEANGFMGENRLAAQRVMGNGSLEVPPIEVRRPALVCAPIPARASAGLAFHFEPAAGGTTIDIIDANGRRVKSVDVSGLASTSGTVRWDSRNADGRLCAPGLYFARLRGKAYAALAKVVIIE